MRVTGQRVAAPVDENQTRCINNVVEKVPDADDRWDALGWSPEETRMYQLDDPVLSQIIEWKRNSFKKYQCFERASGNRALKQYLKLYDELHLVDDILIRQVELADKKIVRQVVVPWSARSRILRFLHDGNGAHGLHTKHSELFSQVQSWFFWIGYRNYVWRWVNKCYKCSRERRKAFVTASDQNPRRRHEETEPDVTRPEGVSSDGLSPAEVPKRRAVMNRVYNASDSAYWREEAARWLQFYV